jgi:hypothetical protein
MEMGDLTPHEKETTRARVETIAAEMDAIVGKSEQIKEWFSLCVELAHLLRTLGEISAVESEAWTENLRKAMADIEENEQLMQALSRELTPDEVAMRALANRLATRQGTMPLDFDALYNRKAELDRRLLDDPPHDHP